VGIGVRRAFWKVSTCLIRGWYRLIAVTIASSNPFKKKVKSVQIFLSRPSYFRKYKDSDYSALCFVSSFVPCFGMTPRHLYHILPPVTIGEHFRVRFGR